MKVLIVDDEPIAQKILEKFCQKLSSLSIVGICSNAIDAIDAIQNLKPDLVFLDIQMPEMSGLEMLRVLRSQDMQVILTTAFHEHALEGYEYNIVDYLLKPIAFERFLKAVTKANDLYKLKYGQKPDASNSENGTKENYIFIKEGRKIVQVCMDKILMVQALKDYVEIILPDKKIVAHITMDKIESFLLSPVFLRVNRSCIIRKNVIKSMQDMHIETAFLADKRIPIGPTYWNKVKVHFAELF